MSTERSELVLLEFVDVVAEFEGGAELQAQVLHDHVALQQQQRVPVDLLPHTDRRGEGKSKKTRTEHAEHYYYLND